MSAIASFLARHCWWWMLYLMRRPWIKRLQHRWLEAVPGERYLRFPDSFMRQNRFARRYGLPLLTLSINLFLASVFITFAYYTITYLYEGGYLNPPDRMMAARAVQR
jgi:hypothetical protein